MKLLNNLSVDTENRDCSDENVYIHRIKTIGDKESYASISYMYRIPKTNTGYGFFSSHEDYKVKDNTQMTIFQHPNLNGIALYGDNYSMY